METIYDIIRTPLLTMAKEGLLPEFFQYAFVVNALLCSFLIGPVLGGVGTMVVMKRLAFFSQSVGQAALTGVALGILLGEPYTAPYISLFGFCILFGLLMNYTRNQTRVSPDTIIGVFLSISLAVGACVLLYVTSKVNVHILDNILFGSILTVNDTDINVLIVISLICVSISLLFFNKFLLASFNPSLAQARKIPVKLLDYLFILMITLITVASLKIVGAVMVEALLVIPAAAARNISRSMRGFFCWSILFATMSCLLGIIVPMQYEIPVPSGGAIIIVAAIFFGITMILRTVHPSFREAIN